MNFDKFFLIQARINGLANPPLPVKGHFELNLILKTSSDAFKIQPLEVKLGDTQIEAQTCLAKIQMSFEKAEIKDGDLVTLLCFESGDVKAIKPLCEDKWLDVDAFFQIKTLEGLNIQLGSLRVL